MILFVSDIHLGRSDPATERSNEVALVRCLEAHEGVAERLYLVGDVFDQYIEYRHLVPKGFVRFQALLARWTDSGIPVTYLVGNHDPWHQSYFEEELGVHVVAGPLIEPAYDTGVYLLHGDGIDSRERLYNLLKGGLRHPLPLWLLTTLLPGDSGYRLAQWVRFAKHRFGSDEIKPSTIESLRAHARAILHASAAGIVVMGHTHFPELLVWPEGCYLNTGIWHNSYTFGSLSKDELRLLRWNGSCTEEIKTHRMSLQAANVRVVER